MADLVRPALRALGLTVACATVVSAQEKACEVNEGSPTQVGRATLNIQVASGAQDPNAAARQLTQAVKSLTENADRMSNQVGRNFVLGKALVLWSMQPNASMVTKRGPLGYATDPEGTINLAAAIDTAFKVVESAHPECVSETARWRGQRGWVNIVNTAIERLNAEDVDSAEVLANQAITLNPYGPYGYVVMANVVQKRGRPGEAFKLYRSSIEMASRDTSYDDIRRQSLIYLGNLAADSAEMAADAAARRPYVEMAKGAFDQIIADKGSTEFRSNAQAGLCRVSIASGDTASLKSTYSEQLNSPAAYDYNTLMNAGVCMARAEMVTEASKLFAGAYEKNPYHRDALSNLAIMYLRNDRHAEALPLAQRLVSVEPNNPENIQLMTLAYAGMAQKARETRMASTKGASAKAGATKTAAPRLSAAAQDSLFKIEKAYTDSAVATNERKDKLAYRVTLSDFSTSEEKATVAGTVTNNGQSSKAITVRVEFLDRTGKVVTSKEASAGTVAPGGAGRFSVTATPGTEIVAFRYAPIE